VEVALEPGFDREIAIPQCQLSFNFWA
jgi:hypothetical protein